MATRTPTTNYNLGKYAPHDNGIADDLNLNMDKVDTQLAKSDPSKVAAVTVIGDADEIMLSVGGVPKKFTGATLKDLIVEQSPPGAIIEYRIPGVSERPVDGSGGKLHLELQIVKEGDPWGTPLFDLSTATAQTNWAYSDGADYAAFPSAGLLAYRAWLGVGEEGNPNPCAVPGIFTEVPFGATGARARFLITAGLENNTLYRYRVRQISVLTSEASDWDVGSFRT